MWAKYSASFSVTLATMHPYIWGRRQAHVHAISCFFFFCRVGWVAWKHFQKWQMHSATKPCFVQSTSITNLPNGLMSGCFSSKIVYTLNYSPSTLGQWPRVEHWSEQSLWPIVRSSNHMPCCRFASPILCHRPPQLVSLTLTCRWSYLFASNCEILWLQFIIVLRSQSDYQPSIDQWSWTFDERSTTIDQLSWNFDRRMSAIEVINHRPSTIYHWAFIDRMDELWVSDQT